MNLYIFDLDNTLAPIGKRIDKDIIDGLVSLKEKGIVCICSGKPIYYLVGLLRQMGVDDILLLGENGAVLQYGVGLPPTIYERLPFDKEAIHELNEIKRKILERYPSMYFQPNEIMLTPFPSKDDEFNGIRDILAKSKKDHLDIFSHCDCFDIVPKGINKGNGALMAIKRFNIPLSNLYTIGDSSNDVPMFEIGGTSIGVGNEVRDHVSTSFPDVRAVLKYLNSSN